MLQVRAENIGEQYENLNCISLENLDENTSHAFLLSIHYCYKKYANFLLFRPTVSLGEFIDRFRTQNETIITRTPAATPTPTS